MEDHCKLIEKDSKAKKEKNKLQDMFTVLIDHIKDFQKNSWYHYNKNPLTRNKGSLSR